MQVWLVTGSTGEYSDRTDWVVGVFASAEGAREHEAFCQKASEEYKAARACRRILPDPTPSSIHLFEAWKKLDPRGHMYYTGTYYAVEGPFEVRL